MAIPEALHFGVLRYYEKQNERYSKYTGAEQTSVGDKSLKGEYVYVCTFSRSSGVHRSEALLRCGR